MDQVITSEPPMGDARRSAARGDAAWSMLFRLGVMLAIIGFTDVGTLLFPGQWTSTEWEFATITGLFDGLPLGTIGLCTMAVAAAGNGWRRTQRVLSVVLTVMAVALIAPFVLYLLDAAVAYRAADDEFRPVLMKAVGKTIVMALTYIVGYAVFGISMWRRLRG